MSVRRRLAVGLMAVCPLVAAAASSVAAQTSGSTPPPQVALHGEGSDDALGEMTAWQNELFGGAKNGLIDLHYLANGGYAGRQDLLSGAIDYVLSGVPFTAAELAKLPNGAGDLIDAPVHVAAMGMLLQPPVTSSGSFGVLRQVCDPNNPPPVVPPGVDPNNCTLWVPFTGPVRIPNPNLAAMLFNYPGGASGGSSPLHQWDNTAVTTAMGVDLTQGTDFGPATFVPQGVVGGSPIPFLRSEPSETDFYLQHLVTAAAPDVWTGLQSFNRVTFGPITERLPVLAVGTRPGVDTQVQAIETPQGIGGGYLAPVPPYAIANAKADAPTLPFEWAQVQNAKGDWLAPTPASINTAVNAGADTPLYALTNSVPNGYPLVWVTHLYAPAHGLSAAKTETLATVIRYLATAGQAATTPAGDGQLPPPLVAKALAAANQLVLSNCTGSGMTLTSSSSPGSYAPPSLAKQQHLDQMLHCAQIPPAPATATAPTTRPVAALTSGGSVSVSQQALAAPSAALPSTGPAPAAVAGPGQPATTKDPGKGIPILAKLPLPLPWSGGGGSDPLSGLVIGAVLFLVARKPWRALVSALKA